MAQRSASAADITRHAVNLARAMTISLRSWGFYPPEHPAVKSTAFNRTLLRRFVNLMDSVQSARWCD